MKKLITIIAFILIPSIAWSGDVTMKKEGSAWVVRDESGVVIPHTDQCQGFPTMIAYAAEHGHDIRVSGGQITSSGVDPSVLNCNQSIIYPPMQGFVAYIGSVTFSFGPSVTGSGMVFDSCMMCTFHFHGQLVYAGSAQPLVFNPRTKLPLDDFINPVIVDSDFYFKTIAHINTGSTGSSAVHFGGLSIVNSIFNFIEVNAESWHGIAVHSQIFNGNTVSSSHIHETNGMGVIHAPKSQGHGNIWNIVTSGAQGFYTEADSDKISLTILGEASPSLTLADGACDNLIFILRIPVPLNDQSGCDNRIF